jgi:hypothetical protein
MQLAPLHTARLTALCEDIYAMRHVREFMVGAGRLPPVYTVHTLDAVAVAP